MTTTPLHFLSATEALAGLRAGDLTSRELLEAYVTRVNALNPALNAVVDQNLALARAGADKADQARHRGEHWGPLHGLPMTMKDTWEVPGMTCTAGAPEYRHHRPKKAGPTIQRVLDAGAIAFGKTNVPYKALDVQSFNPIFGTTCNPWDHARTCGGSSGGAAVALATGMTPLEIGSDIGGSIRIPAHFCGVYGHKATHGLISLRGHIPGPPGHLSEPPLGVAGPMARSADDLRLLLRLMVGDELASPRHERLDQHRVFFWIDDPHCPIDDDMTRIYRDLASKLKAAGALVDIGSPPGMGLKDLYPPYFMQMGALMGAWLTTSERRAKGMVAPLGRATVPLMHGLGKVANLPHSLGEFIDGMTMGLGGWFKAVEHANQLREAFIQTVFSRYDVILTPPTYTPAFRHAQGLLMATRRLTVNGERRHYSDLFMWIAPATLMGLPATSAPVGMTPGGLPVNVQIIGAPNMDHETVNFAGLLAKLDAGCMKRPPG